MSTAILRFLAVALFCVAAFAAAHVALGILNSGRSYTVVETGPGGVERSGVTRPYGGSVLALVLPIALSAGGAIGAGARRLPIVLATPLLLWLFCLVTGFSVGGAFVAAAVSASVAAVGSVVDIRLQRIGREEPAP